MGILHSQFEDRSVPRGTTTEELLRAEIAVKLHVVTGADGASHRDVLEKAFKAADKNSDGQIDFSEFAESAASIGLGVAEGQLRSAFQLFDKNGDGRMQFNELVDFLCPSDLNKAERLPSKLETRRFLQHEVSVQQYERLVANDKSVALETAGATEAGLHDVVQRIASEIYQKEISVRSAFRQWDSDGSGALDVEEFTSALNSLGFSLGIADSQALFRVFDLDDDGRVQCWEFIRALGTMEDSEETCRQTSGNDERKLKAPDAATARAEAEARKKAVAKREAAAKARRAEAAAEKTVAKKERDAKAAAAAELAAKEAAEAEARRRQVEAEAAQAREQDARRREEAAEAARQAQEAANRLAKEAREVAEAQRARLHAEREVAAKKESAAKAAAKAAAAKAADLEANLAAEQAEKERLQQQLEDLQRAQAAQAAEDEEDWVRGLDGSPLERWHDPSANTELYEKGVYAW